MYIFVKHGDNQELMVNHSSKVVNIFDYIRKSLAIENSVELELADLRGEIINLRDHKNMYGSEFTRDKERYVLIKVEQQGWGYDRRPLPLYTPMLNDDQIINETFLSKLKVEMPTAPLPKKTKNTKGNGKSVKQVSHAGTPTSNKGSKSGRNTETEFRSSSKNESRISRDSENSDKPA